MPKPLTSGRETLPSAVRGAKIYDPLGIQTAYTCEVARSDAWDVGLYPQIYLCQAGTILAIDSYSNSVTIVVFFFPGMLCVMSCDVPLM